MDDELQHTAIGTEESHHATSPTRGAVSLSSSLLLYCPGKRLF